MGKVNDLPTEGKPKVGIAKWYSLIILLMAQVGTMGDNSGLFISMNSLKEELGASVSDLALANAMYPLIAGACMIAGGMLGMIWGWRQLLQIGALLLFIAEIVASYTDNIKIFIIIARTLSGFGASFLVPAVLGLIVGIYKDNKDRAIAFGAIAAAVGVANTAIPLVFGYLIDKFDYRIAFNALAAYFLIIFLLAFGLDEVKTKTAKIRFDFIGTILAFLGLSALIVGFIRISEWGLIKPLHSEMSLLGISPAIPLIFLGIIILFIFLRWEKSFEKKHNVCLMPKSFVKTPQLLDGLYMSTIVFFIMGSYIMIGLTYYQFVAGHSALASAGLLSVFSVGMLISSLSAPLKLTAYSCKKLCTTGIGLCALGSVLSAIGTNESSVSLAFYIGAFVMGVGSGIIASQGSVIVTAAVEQRDAMQSGGVQASSRNVGQTIGIAILSCVLLFSLTSSIKSDIANNSHISNETKSQVAKVPTIPFLGNKDFIELVTKHVSNKEDIPILVKINSEARMSSARLAWLVLALICLISMFALTRNIPNYSLSKKS